MPKFTVTLTHVELKSSFPDEMRLVGQPGGGVSPLEGAVASKLNKWFGDQTRPPNHIPSIKATELPANVISFEMIADTDLGETRPVILGGRPMNTNDVKQVLTDRL
jgi:hypothetical protein